LCVVFIYKKAATGRLFLQAFSILARSADMAGHVYMISTFSSGKRNVAGGFFYEYTVYAA
jgi:hypothetical protein